MVIVIESRKFLALYEDNPETQSQLIASVPRLNAFRRIQLALGVWGVILIGGGWLHNNYSAPKAWGLPILLVIWLGLTLVGTVALYWLQPTVLRSGLLFVWAGLALLGLFLTWLIVYPFNNVGREFVSALWHALFALGYIISAYYMDRRLWWLAGWEVLVGLFILVGVGFGVLSDDSQIYKNLGLTFGLSSGLPLLIAALPVWKRH